MFTLLNAVQCHERRECDDKDSNSQHKKHIVQTAAGWFITPPSTKCIHKNTSASVVMFKGRVAAKMHPVGRLHGEEVLESCFWQKPPLVAANVACRAWEALCTCCHSFPLSLSESANGDINQSVDTRAEAVMCHHAGESSDGGRWIAHPYAGNILNRGIISQTQVMRDSALGDLKGTEHFFLLTCSAICQSR